MIAASVVLLAGMTTAASMLVQHEILRVSEGDSDTASILVIHGIAPYLPRYSAAERAEWDRLLGNAQRAWASADRKGRARLVLEILKAMPPSRSVNYHEAGFLLSDTHLVRCRRLSLGDQSLSAWMCTDSETGAYWSVRMVGRAVDLDEMLAELFTSGKEELVERIRASAERGRPIAYVEAVGRQVIVPATLPEPADIGVELAAIWGEIADAAARQRLYVVAALLERLAEERLHVSGKPAGWPKEKSLAAAFMLPFPVAALPGTKGMPAATIEIVSRNDLGPSLDLPDRELTRPWLGEAAWREPDLSGSAAMLLRRLFK